jgi:hypothetical protein
MMADDDTAIPLWAAAKQSGFTVSTLRAEAERGRLVIYKIGRGHYTTINHIREMVRLCRVEPRGRDCTSTPERTNGLSETERISSARAALNQSVVALKQGLPRISGRNTPTLPVATDLGYSLGLRIRTPAPYPSGEERGL